LKFLVPFFFLLGFVLPACATDHPLRYRGQYSFGHEVNTFCPEINSQCYWIGPDTTQQQRGQLKHLVEEHTDEAYQSICIVVEGKINRDPVAKQAIGFAAEYDGLFTVTRLYGLCDGPKVVTQGDLQHHRWVLESIDLVKVDSAKLGGKVPELEIGEQMMASGDSGCNRFMGQAALRGDHFIIEHMASTRMFCQPAQNEIETLLLQLLGRESEISIDAGRNLILKSGNNLLIFRLQDRVE
jgi:heat shock protein HslJ